MSSETDVQTMLQGLQGKTMSAKLKPLLPEIDRKIQAGIRHEEIVEALKDQGLEVELTNFRSILYRYRKKVASTKGGAAVGRRDGNSAELQQRVSPVPSDEQAPYKYVDNTSVSDMLNPAESNAFTDQFMERKPGSLLKKRTQ